MGDESGMSAEALKAELAYLTGDGPKMPIYPKEKSTLTEAGSRIITCATTVEDPFTSSFPHANPWLPKKDNKGKKDRVGPPKRAPVQLL